MDFCILPYFRTMGSLYRLYAGMESVSWLRVVGPLSCCWHDSQARRFPTSSISSGVHPTSCDIPSFQKVSCMTWQRIAYQCPSSYTQTDFPDLSSKPEILCFMLNFSSSRLGFLSQMWTSSLHWAMIFIGLWQYRTAKGFPDGIGPWPNPMGTKVIQS